MTSSTLSQLFLNEITTLAHLYTIILATVHLERTYTRDAVTEQEVKIPKTFNKN